MADLAVAIQYGYTAKAKADASGIRYLRITDIQGDRVDWQSVPSCDVGEDESKKYLLSEGDLVFARTGATVGKSYLIRGSLPKSVFASYLIRVRMKEGIDPRYVAYFFQSPSYWQQIAESAAGIGQPNVNGTKLAQIRVPVAPSDQQIKIVEEIDKQFSRLDEAVANLQRVKANLKRYKAAVLKAAVEGRLVETEASIARREGRGYETGEQLLQRILEARRSQWVGRGKYKDPCAVEAPENLVLPAGWAIASLDMLSNDSGYGTSQKCSYENEGPPVLRIPNVQNAVLDLQDLKRAPSDFQLADSDALRQGDMLIIRTNGSKSLIGRAAVVLAEQSTRMSFASYLIRFRLNQTSHLAAWVSIVWQSTKMREWIEAQAATSAGQHNVSMTVLARAAIPVPPIPEQERIVAEVDRHLSIIREVEAEIDANLQRAQALRQSVLTKAFAS